MVAFDTRYGRFVAQLFEKEAPISTANLLNRVDNGLLANSSIYRIVTLANQPDTVPAKIEVVQFGLTPAARETDPLPPIAHEPTAATGLRHLDGTLSMARLAPGTAGSAFFICIGDQPELDFGGHRNPDGQGFAAFGQIVEGMDVVRKIFAQAEDATDQLSDPIPIDSVARV
ncbi:peptidylprolyl isomerase [Microvirga calopogonii]|uniref:peptidylprolyl isomerase n=1 Tax=Microvirga calopogonii TaxID=2078013 RepID=UPI00197BA5F1|nr:peptidylprolyl isomerase [Microvirga calopogonii]